MTPEHWQQVKAVFQQTLERDSSERAAWLAQACVGDDALRGEVEKLLAGYEQAGSFIETPAHEVAADFLAAHTSLTGQQLNHYQILSLLGKGGMGEVYQARDTQLDRTVALKILPADLATDAERMRRFVREAKAASALNHPHVATIYEIGAANGVRFIAMEYVAGQTLAARINGAPLPVAEIVAIGSQITDALDEAHGKGITHRDLKPANVMLTPRGQVKVLDFGLAKIARPPSADSNVSTLQQTNPGVVLGTVPYMSPEQALGREVDQRSDLFSLGVVLYEMATGRLPFAGANTVETLDRILHAQPEALAQFNPDAPAELERIVRKCLEKERAARYQTAKDLLADLNALKQSAATEAKPARADSHNAAVVSQPASSAEYLLGEIKQHKRAVLLTLALLLAFGTGITYWLLQRHGRQQPDTAASALQIARLTHTGKAVQAAVSPDGKYVAYAKDEAGRQSLWLIQVATTSDEQILPPAEVSYRGLTFSRDGNFIYYVRDEQNASTGTLYRKPVLGGAERKLLSDVDSPITLSPDGDQLAFVRYVAPAFSEHALMIANADGAEERRLAVSKPPRGISNGGLAWSPDGKFIACGILNWGVGFSASVILVRVADGAEQAPGSWQWPQYGGKAGTAGNRWGQLGRLAWNEDGSALFLTINEPAGAQIWRLSWPEGEARKVTTELCDYESVSLTAGPDRLDAKLGARLVAVRSDRFINLQVAPTGDASRLRPLTTGAGREDGVRGLDWTPDGRIVYRSAAGGDPHIWITAADGTSHKQLTSAARNHIDPAVSPDGRYIDWGVNRDGRFNLWRMEMDGSNAKPMTSGDGEWFPQSSPDGRWLVYRTFSPGIMNALWKAPLDGGPAVRLTEDISWLPSLSPDGKLIACNYRRDERTHWQIVLIPFDGGPPKFIESVEPATNHHLRWTSDGRALTYAVTRGGVSNLWAQPLDGSPPKQLTAFKEQFIFNFAWSRDGKQLALSRGSINSDVVLISNFK